MHSIERHDYHHHALHNVTRANLVGAMLDNDVPQPDVTVRDTAAVQRVKRL